MKAINRDLGVNLVSVQESRVVKKSYPTSIILEAHILVKSLINLIGRLVQILYSAPEKRQSFHLVYQYLTKFQAIMSH